jgi:hypothetical protein
VLFNEMVRRARERGWYAGAEETVPGTPLVALIALMARDVLLEMSRRHRAAEKVKRAMGVLKAFASVSVVGVRLDINAEAVTGTADTGILELDLRRLFVTIGALAQLQGVGALFALDEVHAIGNSDLYTFNSALHATAQQELPVAFVGAGLFPSWQGSGPPEEDPQRDAVPADEFDSLLVGLARQNLIAMESTRSQMFGLSSEISLSVPRLAEYL